MALLLFVPCIKLDLSHSKLLVKHPISSPASLCTLCMLHILKSLLLQSQYDLSLQLHHTPSAEAVYGQHLLQLWLCSYTMQMHLYNL